MSTGQKIEYSEPSSTVKFMHYETDLIFRKGKSSETITHIQIKTTFSEVQKCVTVKEVIA